MLLWNGGMMSSELEIISKFAEKYGLFKKGTLVLCAISGGADSMCLLRLMEELSHNKSFQIAAIHFNHCLREEESDRDERFVSDYCSGRGIEFYSESGDVAGYARNNTVSIETAARKLRYAFFEKMASRLEAETVVTAHNADDNAETVLFNLTRGTGINGLTGIPPIRDIYARPILHMSRNEIEAYLEKNGVPHIDDSTNEEDEYTRNKLRHLVVPVLKAINPSFSGNVASMTELLNADRQYLDSMAAQLLEGVDNSRLPVELINSQPFSISSRIIKQSLESLNLTVDFAHVVQLLSLAKEGGPSDEIALPGGSAHREYDTMVLVRGEIKLNNITQRILLPGKNIIKEIGMSFTLTEENEKIHNTFNTFFFKKASICGNIIIRSRQSGDKITFYGRNVTKSIKKLFIDEKVPQRNRNIVPVFADDDGVIAIWGFGTAERCHPCDNEATIKIVGESISE